MTEAPSPAPLTPTEQAEMLAEVQRQMRERGARTTSQGHHLTPPLSPASAERPVTPPPLLRALTAIGSRPPIRNRAKPPQSILYKMPYFLRRLRSFTRSTSSSR